MEALSGASSAPGGLERFFNGIARLVTGHPKKFVFSFLLVAALFLPAIGQLQLYMSFYQLIPEERREGDAFTRDYFDDYLVLNREYGGDNWDYYLFRPNQTGLKMTDVVAIREMNAIAERLAGFDYVEGTLSLAELVKIVNRLLTGSYEFPPDSPEGDQRIRNYIDFLLCRGTYAPPPGQECAQRSYRDQIYGTLLSKDEETAVMVIIMTKNEPLEQYREYARELKEFGFDIDQNNPYQQAITAYPFNLETIYLKLDEATLDEGVYWVLGTLAAVIIISGLLFRSAVYTALQIANLTLVVFVTVGVLYLVGGYLNILTMLLVALIFGVGDDYTAYALTVYRNARMEGMDLIQSIKSASHELGSSLLVTALVTLSGFVAIYLTGFPAIMIFGLMAGAGVFLAYVSTVVFIPAVLYLDARRRLRKAGGKVDKATQRLFEHGRRTSKLGGNIGAAAWRHRKVVVAVFGLAILGFTYPIVAGYGVQTWDGTYNNVFSQDTYEMRTYNLAADTIGIPLEGVVFLRGEMTDPEVLRFIDALDRETGTSVDDPQRDHAWLRSESLAKVVRNNYATHGPTGSDRDGDLLPDDAGSLRSMYDRMRDDPATAVSLVRVLRLGGDLQYKESILRVSFNSEFRGQVGDRVFDSPADNAEQSTQDLIADLQKVLSGHPAAGKIEHASVTGLTVTELAVIEAIDFGNKWTTYIMIGFIFTILMVAYRNPVHCLIVMTPLLFGALVQYGIMAIFHLQMTYVSVILTSIDMGLGIDLGVHQFVKFRELMRAGRSPLEAVKGATGQANFAMIGAILTDMSAFMLIPFSDITWAAETARILIPSLTCVLIVAVLVVPILLVGYANLRPQSFILR